MLACCVSALGLLVLLQTKVLFYLQVSFVMNTFHIQNQKNRDDSDPSRGSEAPKTPLSIQLQIAFENAFSIVYGTSLPPLPPLPPPPRSLALLLVLSYACCAPSHPARWQLLH